LPTGGAIEYDMTSGSGVETGMLNDGNTEYEIVRRVVERRTYADGTTREGRTTYGSSGGGVTDPLNLIGVAKTTVTVDHYDTDGTTRLSRDNHYYYGLGDQSVFNQQAGLPFSDWHDGHEYETDLLKADASTILCKSIVYWQARSVPSWSSSFGNPANDPRETEVDAVLNDTNQVSKQTYSYSSDAYNNRDLPSQFDELGGQRLVEQRQLEEGGHLHSE
jgi:hypothetical protein